MSNHLKKLMLSLIILLLPHMNLASNAMDLEEEKGSPISLHSNMAVNEEFEDSTDFSKKSTSSQPKNSEEFSWSSYFSSNAHSILKNSIQSASDVMNFTIKNPKLAMLFGSVILLEKAMVAANCTCLCQFPHEASPYPYSYFGEQKSLVRCQVVCHEARAMNTAKCI